MTDTATTARSTRARPLALAYVRVSTADQAEHGASLDAQAAMAGGAADLEGADGAANTANTANPSTL